MKTEGLYWDKRGQRGSFVKRSHRERSHRLLGSQTDTGMCAATTEDVDHADIDVVVCVCMCVCWRGGQMLSALDTNQELSMSSGTDPPVASSSAADSR